MCSRHIEEGAGAEYQDRADSTCDYCGRTQWRGPLHRQTIGHSTAWLCDKCVARDAERYARMVAS